MEGKGFCPEGEFQTGQELPLLAVKLCGKEVKRICLKNHIEKKPNQIWDTREMRGKVSAQQVRETRTGGARALH